MKNIDERMDEQGILPYYQDGKWVVTYLLKSIPGDHNGVNDAEFDSFLEAYKFALEILK